MFIGFKNQVREIIRGEKRLCKYYKIACTKKCNNVGISDYIKSQWQKKNKQIYKENIFKSPLQDITVDKYWYHQNSKTRKNHQALKS